MSLIKLLCQLQLWICVTYRYSKRLQVILTSKLFHMDGKDEFYGY